MKPRIKNITAAAIAIALAAGGIGGTTLAANAAEPAPPITDTVAWQSATTISDSSGEIASFSETKNQTGANTLTYNGVPKSGQPVVRLHIGQEITMSKIVRVNSAADWWWIGDSNSVTSAFFTPFEKFDLAEWSAPDCAFPAQFARDSGVIEFACSMTFVIPANAPPSYGATYGTPKISVTNQYDNDPGLHNVVFETFSPSWTYLAAATSLVPAAKEYEVVVGDSITVTPAMLKSGATDDDGNPAEADGVTVVSVPTGAVVSPDQTIQYTAVSTGRFAFTFVLSNSESNVQSAVAPGGILATDDGGPIPEQPEPTPSIVPAPQHYSATVGTPITLDLDTIAAGCTVTDGSICAPDSISFTTLPNGAQTAPNGFVWTPTAAGDAEFSFTLTDSVTGISSVVTIGVIASVLPPVIDEPVDEPEAPVEVPETPETPDAPVTPNAPVVVDPVTPPVNVVPVKKPVVTG